EAFEDTKSGLASTHARTILAAAPTPALAAKLTKARLRRLLIAAGRQRNIDARIDQLHTAFAGEQMRAWKPPSEHRPEHWSCNSTPPAEPPSISPQQPKT